jgi:creatinine amidohydrolase
MNAPGRSPHLADMTAPDFAQAASSKPVILLPLGSHEDHGPHLPMGDYFLAERLAGRIAEAAVAMGSPSFVAPCLPFGVADYFGSSPGGLALSPAAFRATLTDLLEGLLRHGLDRIVILNGHGGNVPVIHEVTLTLRRERGVVIPSFYLWKIARKLMERRIEAGRFGHGAEPLLSLTMALRGETVGASEIAPPPQGLLGLRVSHFGTLDFEGVEIEAPAEFDAVPRAAVTAAWPSASAALGQEVADELVALGARFVAHVASVASAASASGVSKSRSTAPD